MDSSVLSSLPVLLVTAGLALLAAGMRMAQLARHHRRRMENLLRLVPQDIEPLDLPATAWPELAEAGWQGLAWEGHWFGQAVEGTLGNPAMPLSPLPEGVAKGRERWNSARHLTVEAGSDETRLRLCFSATTLRGEKLLFAEQLARVFVLLLETRLRARSEALAAALAERARLSLYLQHDMRNLAQWVCWVSADFARSGNPEQLQGAAARLRDNAPLAKERAERLIAALGQTPVADRPETINLRQAIAQAAQLAGFAAEIDGEAEAWIARGLLARVLDNLFSNLAAAWRDPHSIRPVFQLRRDPRAERENEAAASIEFFCPWPQDTLPLPAEKLFEPFASGRPGGLGLGLYQARKSLIEAGGELRASPSAEGLRFLLRLPAPPAA